MRAIRRRAAWPARPANREKKSEENPRTKPCSGAARAGEGGLGFGWSRARTIAPQRRPFFLCGGEQPVFLERGGPAITPADGVLGASRVSCEVIYIFSASTGNAREVMTHIAGMQIPPSLCSFGPACGSAQAPKCLPAPCHIPMHIPLHMADSDSGGAAVVFVPVAVSKTPS